MSKTLTELLKENEKIIEGIDHLDHNECDVFKILGCSRHEIRHSNFMIWLLRNKTFLKEFTHNCGIFIDDLIDTEDYIVNREETYEVRKLLDHDIVLKNAKETEKYRHIDINIIGKTFTITIENKVDSDEHDDQCVSYYNYMMDSEGEYKHIKDENKYFVFLAKNDPKRFEFFGGLSCDEEVKRNEKIKRDDKMAWENVKVHTTKEFDDSNAQLKFFNYRLIKYTTIRDILEKNLFEDSFESKLVEQYKNIIKEWEHLGEKYRKICKDISDDDLLTIVDNYKDWRNSKLYSEDSKEMRFIEVAYQYYREEKAKIDGKILPILNALISGKTLIKTDYGRGNYANALPLVVDVLGDSDKVDFAEKLLKSKEASKKIITLKDGEEVSIESLLKCHEGYLIAYEEYKKAERTKNKKKKTIDNYNKAKGDGKTVDDEEMKRAQVEFDKANAAYEERKIEQESLMEKRNSMLDAIFKNFNIISEEKKELRIKSNALPKNRISAQTVDYRAPMSGNNNISIATIGGFTASYSINLCKNILSNENYVMNYNSYLNDHKEAKVIFKYSFSNGSGFGDKIYDSKKTFNLPAFYTKFKNIMSEKNAEIKDELFIKKMNFEEMFFEDDFFDFLNKLKEIKDEKDKNSIAPQDELDNMMEAMLTYFVGYKDEEKTYGGYDKLEKAYENLKDNIILKGKNFEPEYTQIVEKIKKISPKVAKTIKSKYVDGLKKKIKIVKSGLEGDKSNNVLNFTWLLFVEYDINVVEIKSDRMSKESAKKLAEKFYDTTVDELQLFGYDAYCKNHLFVQKDEINMRIEKIEDFIDN